MDDKNTMDEFEKGLEAITVPEKWLNGNQYRTGYRQACIEIAAKYRAFKAKAVPRIATTAVQVPITCSACGHKSAYSHIVQNDVSAIAVENASLLDDKAKADGGLVEKLNNFCGTDARIGGPYDDGWEDAKKTVREILRAHEGGK